MELKGVIPATVTPFTKGGAKVDLEWIPRHLEYLCQRGVDGILPLGTAGEGTSLSLWEKKLVIDKVMKTRGRLAVMVGTGCAALPETVEISRYALEKGADAVLVVPPFYFKDIAQPGLWEYYRAVFQVLPSDGKVVLYNIPSLSGVEISDDLIDALLGEYPSQLLGIKDTSGQLEKIEHYIRRYPKLLIYSGSDNLVGPSLRAGVSGTISAIANVFPELIMEVHRAHSGRGSIEAAQRKVNRVRELLKKYPTKSAIKFLLHIIAGLPVTHVRPPLTELTPEQAAKLGGEVKALLSPGKE